MVSQDDGKGPAGADFWEGDPTKHFSVKKKGSSVKRGEGFSE